MNVRIISILTTLMIVAVVSAILMRSSDASDANQERSDTTVTDRIDQLERRVAALESSAKERLREHEQREELVQIIDNSYRGVAVKLAELAREYASAVAETPTDINAIAKLKVPLLRQCDLVDELEKQRKRIANTN